jgi:hypothetical protein
MFLPASPNLGVSVVDWKSAKTPTNSQKSRLIKVIPGESRKG